MADAADENLENENYQGRKQLQYCRRLQKQLQAPTTMGPPIL